MHTWRGGINMKKRLFSLIAVFAFIFSLNGVPVHADGDWGTQVKVTQKDQVVDTMTFNGVTVNAYFNPYEQDDLSRVCTELVDRFYWEVYGDRAQDLVFIRTDTPAVGDWATSGGHDAIVKAVNGNRYTLFEQNYWYMNRKDNIALKGRVTTGTSEFVYYHPIFRQEAEQVEAFVTRLYQLCLNREPDESGMDYWMSNLLTGKKDAAQVVYGFFFSEEMKGLKLSDEDYVERCYSVMMDRASDEGGKKYWVEHLENGVTRLYVVRGFVESNEFTGICKNYGVTRGSLKLTDPRDQNYGITSFVARCYTQALGRKYDEGGLKNWVNQILYASNRKQAAIDSASTGFFHSQEFRNKKLGNTEYVKVLYRTFLGREYDEPGLKDWVGQLNSGKKNRDQVMNGFAYSKEFNKIMADYGL